MPYTTPFVGADRSTLLHPPHAISAFIDTLTQGVPALGRNADERRQQPRYAISTIVEVQALSDNFQPLGEMHKCVTRDISRTGLRLMHTHDFGTKHMALQITSPTGDKLQTMLEVVHCEKRGAGNVYDIGGRFIAG